MSGVAELKHNDASPVRAETETSAAAVAAALFAAENGAEADVTVGNGTTSQVPYAVRLLWVDAGGIRRVRAVQYSDYKKACERGVSFAQACMGLVSYADIMAPKAGVTTAGEALLIPQSKPYVQLPYYPAHCLTVAELHKVPGQPWELCPRAALRHVLQHAKDTYGLDVALGFESEFVLMQPKGGSSGEAPSVNLALAGHQEVVPFDAHAYCNSRSFMAAAHVMDDMVAGLTSCGIRVQQYHAEAAPGQFEISTAPYDALTAVDKLVVTREVITGITHKHQLLASFLPKIQSNAAGNGAHVHISVWKDGKNLLEGLNPGEAPTAGPGASFVAGVLQHLPALLPFIAPSHFSYERLAPHCWSGAFNVWGWDNREAPIRMTIPPSGPHNTNFELKSCDATCNPYVAMAAIITAGLAGLVKELPLPAPVSIDPADMSPEEFASSGLVRLPSSLEDALKVLKDDTEILDALNASLGPALVKCMIGVREAELDYKPSVTEALFRW